MDNQHRAIKGYRELTQAEIDLMNKIKEVGPHLKELCDSVRAHVERQRTAAQSIADASGDDQERDRLVAAEPDKWANWANDSFQVALMYLTRAVAQPTTF